MKKLYLCVDWESRSIGVSTKKDWEEYKLYLVGENNCGVYEDGDSIEIYDESNEDVGGSMVELTLPENFELT